MMRVYVLERGFRLPPLVFSSLAKAKAHGRLYVPFSSDWERMTRESHPHDFLRNAPQWVGVNGGKITSVALDQNADGTRK